MIELSFILFLAIILFALFSNSPTISKDKSSFVYWFTCIVLISFVAFREVGIDRDSLGYFQYYHLGDFIWLMAEPTFGIISEFSRYVFNDFRVVLIIYAILGVYLKFRAIDKLTDLKWLTLIVYFSTFFLLHEFTQIRASIASGIFLLAITYLAERKLFKYMLLIFIACFFHYSAIVLFGACIFTNKHLNKWQKILIALAIPVGVVMHFMKINPITIIPIETIKVKVELYVSAQENSDQRLNVFNLVYLAKYAILYYVLFFYEAIYKHTKYVSIFIKLYALSLFFYLALSINTIIAMRISEIFGVVEIFVIPYIYYTIKPRPIAAAIIICIAFIYLLINIFSLGLIQPQAIVSYN